MGELSVKAWEVITYPEGTLALVNGAGETERAMSVAFFDRNRNGKLDGGDQKILVDPMECRKGAKRVEDATGKTFCIEPVQKPDVARYGQAVGGIFKRAWEARLALPKVLKPQAAGTCTIDVPPGLNKVSTSLSFGARFREPLSLKTVTALQSKRYTARDLERLLQEAGEELPVVDPSRCAEAQASLELPAEGEKLGMKLAISGRLFLGASYYAGLPLALGLREHPELPRLAGKDGRGVMHLNLKP